MSVVNFPNKKPNKKKIAFCILIFAIILFSIIFKIIYTYNLSFRRFVDLNVLRKEIKNDTLSTIELNSEEDNFYCSYDKYIAIINKKILYIYNSSGEKLEEYDINIASPIFSYNNKFLLIGEENGSNIYLISGTNVVYQKTIEGNISNVNVNKNGYASIITSGNSYKSIILSFDLKGNELFKTYISTNLAIISCISHDNKYLSIGEIDYSGSIIKSTIKTISIENAKNNPSNSIISVYSLENNLLLTNLKYNTKNTVIFSTNSTINLLDVINNSNSVISTFENKYDFIDINLSNNFIYTYNESFGLSNTLIANIYNYSSQSVNTYKFNGSIKSIYTNENKIALNTGSEIHFINTNGWLIKKYISYNEIKNILLGDNIAGIVYKNKIEIIEI